MYRKLHFGVVSTQIVERADEKYVTYTVEAKIVSEKEDPKPAYFARRYRDFLNLYEQLNLRYPEFMSRIQFPGKTYFWNFSHDVIAARSDAFEKFLTLINSESVLRSSPMFISFLQEKEMYVAVRFVRRESYKDACSLAENCFHLMNKVETDRSPSVLRWLCLLVCVAWLSGDQRATNLAALAVRRYDEVCDIDLLRLYVPLLYTAEDIYLASGEDSTPIRDKFTFLRSKGHQCNRTEDLLNLLICDFSHATNQH